MDQTLVEKMVEAKPIKTPFATPDGRPVTYVTPGQGTTTKNLHTMFAESEKRKPGSMYLPFPQNDFMSCKCEPIWGQTHMITMPREVPENLLEIPPEVLGGPDPKPDISEPANIRPALRRQRVVYWELECQKKSHEGECECCVPPVPEAATCVQKITPKADYFAFYNPDKPKEVVWTPASTTGTKDQDVLDTMAADNLKCLGGLDKRWRCVPDKHKFVKFLALELDCGMPDLKETS